MAKNYFVFTYGQHCGQDYSGGHIKIYAEDYSKARERYAQIFPPKDGTLKFSFQYTQKEWEETPSWLKGFNEHCHCTFGRSTTEEGAI